jgi:hypothetical protein
MFQLTRGRSNGRGRFQACLKSPHPESKLILAETWTFNWRRKAKAVPLFPNCEAGVAHKTINWDRPLFLSTNSITGFSTTWGMPRESWGRSRRA